MTDEEKTLLRRAYSMIIALGWDAPNAEVEGDTPNRIVGAIHHHFQGQGVGFLYRSIDEAKTGLEHVEAVLRKDVERFR